MRLWLLRDGGLVAANLVAGLLALNLYFTRQSWGFLIAAFIHYVGALAVLWQMRCPPDDEA